MKTPPYLYHYTNIQGLAHILQSKRIRFSPLSSLDDKLEGLSKDLSHFKNYVFVSSWTDLERESIPFWNMYASQMKGVRIKMSSNMFKKHIHVLTSNILSGIEPNKYMVNPSIIDQNQSLGFNENYIVLPSNGYLKKIDYKPIEKIKDYNDNDFYKKNLDGSFFLKTDKIGNIKTEEWRFQSEWRFFAFALPCDYSQRDAFKDMFQKLHDGATLNLDYLYADLTDESFQNMEILLGPRMQEADKIIVKSLLYQYNPKALNKVKDSDFEIR